MSKLLWEPSEEQVKNANMSKFIDFVNKKYEKNFESYFDLYDWSINSIADFWAAMWEFGEVKASQPYKTVVDDLGKFPGANWFVGAKLNYAENLLRLRDDHTAFIFKGETQKEVRMSYSELYNTVARLSKSLRDMGVKPGDRVVGYMPNMIETACAMLAATSCGAIQR
jgi:acetoacetyl-CoA synthetase